MKKCLFGTLFLFTLKAFAILPPFYHTSAQYRMLLDDPQLAEKLGSGQAIESISLGEGGFTVKTPKFDLEVDVVYERQDRPGPAKYHLYFHDPKER